MITVLNTDGGGVSEYPLDSVGVAAVGEDVYFISPTMLVEEGAETVVSQIKTGWFSPGATLNKKRIDRVRFVLDTQDAIVVYVGVRNYTGEVTHGPFAVLAVNDASPSSRVLRMPRWVEGQYFQLDIRNVNGGELGLTEVVIEAEQGAQVRGG